LPWVSQKHLSLLSNTSLVLLEYRAPECRNKNRSCLRAVLALCQIAVLPTFLEMSWVSCVIWFYIRTTILKWICISKILWWEKLITLNEDDLSLFSTLFW
jgi:hypothetical protein